MQISMQIWATGVSKGFLSWQAYKQLISTTSFYNHCGVYVSDIPNVTRRLIRHQSEKNQTSHRGFQAYQRTLLFLSQSYIFIGRQNSRHSSRRKTYGSAYICKKKLRVEIYAHLHEGYTAQRTELGRVAYAAGQTKQTEDRAENALHKLGGSGRLSFPGPSADGLSEIAEKR